MRVHPIYNFNLRYVATVSVCSVCMAWAPDGHWEAANPKERPRPATYGRRRAHTLCVTRIQELRSASRYGVSRYSPSQSTELFIQIVSAHSEIRSYMYGVLRRHSYRLQSNIGGAHHHMAFAVPKRKKNVTYFVCTEYGVRSKDSSFPPKHISTSRFGTWGKSSGLFQRNAMLANWRRCRYKRNAQT